MPPSFSRLELRAAPDSRAVWLAVCAAFFVYLVSVGLQYTTGVFFKAWRAAPEFAATSPATLAWATSLESAFFLVGSLAAGKAIVRVGERWTILAGAGCIAGGTLAAALIDVAAPAAALASLCLFFGIVTGSGAALVHVAAVVAVQKFFRKRRGLATGITVAGSGVGSIVLGPALEALVDAVGWRLALVTYGLVAAATCAAAAAVIGMIVLVEPATVPAPTAAEAEVATQSPLTVVATEPDMITPEPASAAAAAATMDWKTPSAQTPEVAHSSTAFGAAFAAPATAVLSDDGELLRPKGIMALAAPPSRPTYRWLLGFRFFRSYSSFVAFFSLCWFTIPTFLPVTITAALGGSSADVAGIFAVQGVANTLGRVALGIAVDVLPRHKLAILSACLLTVTAASLAFVAAPSLGLAYAYAAVLGGAGGSIVSLQPAIVIDALGLAALPLAQGAFNAVQAPSALIGPPIGGAILAASGGYAGTWAFITAGFTVAAALSLCVGDAAPWVRERGVCARAQSAQGAGRGGKAADELAGAPASGHVPPIVETGER